MIPERENGWRIVVQTGTDGVHLSEIEGYGIKERSAGDDCREHSNGICCRKKENVLPFDLPAYKKDCPYRHYKNSLKFEAETQSDAYHAAYGFVA